MQFFLAEGPFGLSTSQLALLVSGVAVIFVVRRWRQNTVRRMAAKPVDRPVVQTNALSVREVAAEVAALLSELEETSRRLTAQLDNRYMRLEQLVEEADEKIRRLEALQGGVVGVSKVAEEARPEPRAAADLAAAVSEGQRALTRLREERGAPPAARDPAYQPIYSLADRGKSSREIAQELGRQPGEIELILALRQHGG